MKKIKLIAAGIAAALVLNTTVFAGYYKRADIKPFDGSAIVYEPYDEGRADKLITDIRAIIGGEPGKEAELRELLDGLLDEFLSARYSATTAKLISDRYYNSKNLTNYMDAAEAQINIAEKISEVVKDIYSSPYSEILGEAMDVDAYELEEFINDIPSERFYELSRKEEELVTRYGEIYGDSDACAELYIELVALRNEIAKEEGYDNYADFARDEIYMRDYDDDELAAFGDAVAAYLTPLWKAVYNVSYGMEDKYVPKASDAELIAQVGDFMYDINDELGASYSFMIDNNLYDIELREGKDPSSGSYTVTLDEKGVPYLFLSDTKNDVWHVKNFIHESGHFCSLLNMPEMDDKWQSFMSTTSIDTCEIHSQGLEMLTQYYYGRLFGDDAANERFETTASILENVIDGCYFHEWQKRIYKEKNLTVDRANEIASELVEKYYGISDFSKSTAQDMWTSVHHNYVSPMYYVSYAVSAAAALEIYTISCEDYAAAKDKYMRISALGGNVPFREATETAGLPDVLAPETVLDISQEIGKSLGFAYLDVDYDLWYAPYIYATAHIADGRGMSIPDDDTEFMSFAPDASVTRAEFVKLIGKMYDYYKGIDGEYTLSYEDVDPEDESARYIMWAAGAGVIDGYSDKEFGPDDPITREQLAAILYRLYKYEGGSAAADGYDAVSAYSDLTSVSDWAIVPMSWTVREGILNGRENDLLVPHGNTTRAEAVTLAARYIDLAY